MKYSRNMIRMPLPDVLVWFPVERAVYDAKTEMWELEEFIFPVI